MDCFTLNYNTLIYVLQKKCGFQTVSYFVEEKNTSSEENDNKKAFIYILLSQTTENILKSADHFRIKKEIDYSQIDLFMNEPVDELQRPYQNNTALSSIQKDVLNSIKQRKFEELNNLKKYESANGHEILLKIDKKKDRRADIFINKFKKTDSDRVNYSSGVNRL